MITLTGREVTLQSSRVGSQPLDLGFNYEIFLANRIFRKCDTSRGLKWTHVLGFAFLPREERQIHGTIHSAPTKYGKSALEYSPSKTTDT